MQRVPIQGAECTYPTYRRMLADCQYKHTSVNYVHMTVSTRTCPLIQGWRKHFRIGQATKNAVCKTKLPVISSIPPFYELCNNQSDCQNGVYHFAREDDKLDLLPNFTSQKSEIIAKRFDNHAVVFISGWYKTESNSLIYAKFSSE